MRGLIFGGIVGIIGVVAVLSRRIWMVPGRRPRMREDWQGQVASTVGRIRSEARSVLSPVDQEIDTIRRQVNQVITDVERLRRKIDEGSTKMGPTGKIEGVQRRGPRSRREAGESMPPPTAIKAPRTRSTRSRKTES